MNDDLRTPLSVRMPFAAFVLSWTVTFLVYVPALHNAFVDLDDRLFVTDNPTVQRGWSSLAVAWRYLWTSRDAANWVPMTWASHITDVALFGLEPMGHHLTSNLLHACNAGLLAMLLLRLGASTPWAVLGALVFSLHPLRVESVAWIAERRDVLSGFFLLCTLLSWHRFAQHERRRDYLLALCTGALGMLSKPMLVTLPAMLLLFDIWPLGRIRLVDRQLQGAHPVRLVVEKLPFCMLAIGDAVATLWAQQQAIVSVDEVPASSRLTNAAVSIMHYVADVVWPTHLAVLYPYPQGGWSLTTLLIAGATLATISGAAIWRTRRSLDALCAWLWFIGTLVPVLGLVQVGFAARADRYTYVPLLLPTIAAAVGASTSRAPWRTVLASVVVLALGGKTWLQIPVWRDTRALFTHAVTQDPDNGHAWQALATDSLRRGDLAAAEEQALRAVATRGGLFSAHLVLGLARAGLSRHREAIENYVDALTLRPTSATTHAALATSLLAIGDVGSALSEVSRIPHVEVIGPTHARALLLALVAAGRAREAAPFVQPSAPLLDEDERLRHDALRALCAAGRADEARRIAAAVRDDRQATVLATCAEEPTTR